MRRTVPCNESKGRSHPVPPKKTGKAFRYRTLFIHLYSFLRISTVSCSIERPFSKYISDDEGRDRGACAQEETRIKEAEHNVEGFSMGGKGLGRIARVDTFHEREKLTVAGCDKCRLGGWVNIGQDGSLFK